MRIKLAILFSILCALLSFSTGLLIITNLFPEIVVMYSANLFASSIVYYSSYKYFKYKTKGLLWES